jgi:hypothetical protein
VGDTVLVKPVALHKKQISPLMNADYTDKEGQFFSKYSYVEAFGLISVISVNQRYAVFAQR